MNQFRSDNTEGYTAAELAEMNREFASAMSPYDRDHPDYEQIAKTLAEQILRQHDGA